MKFPAKLKIGVSGCPFCCGESYVRDIGIVGKKRGWTLIFGGNSGRKPRIGDVLAEDLETDALLKMTENLLLYYRDNAKKRERTSQFADRVGIDKLKKAITKDKTT
jgi:NAD(P)H-nitrite reductase large subunit